MELEKRFPLKPELEDPKLSFKLTKEIDYLILKNSQLQNIKQLVFGKNILYLYKYIFIVELYEY